MTFDFTFGHTHTTMDLGTLIFTVLLAAFLLWLIYWTLSRGIRSLCGKPLNNPPSPIFWAKVTADVVEEDTEDLWHGIPEAFQISHKVKKGTSIVDHEGYMKRVHICKVAYTYHGERYTSFVQDCAVRNGKAEIYCYRRKPESAKVFHPDQPWSKASGVSMLFFGILMILMGVITICGIVS